MTLTKETIVPGLQFIAKGAARRKYRVYALKGNDVVIQRGDSQIFISTTVPQLLGMIAEIL